MATSSFEQCLPYFECCFPLKVAFVPNLYPRNYWKPIFIPWTYFMPYFSKEYSMS